MQQEYVSGGSRQVPAAPPQWDPILSFLHVYLPKSAHVGGRRPPPGNPGSTAVRVVYTQQYENVFFFQMSNLVTSRQYCQFSNITNRKYYR